MEKIIIAIVLSFAIGAAGGYLFAKKGAIGFGKSVREEACSLKESGVSGSGATTSALKEIKEKANPYSEIQKKANPFKDVYINPFAQ